MVVEEELLAEITEAQSGHNLFQVSFNKIKGVFALHNFESRRKNACKDE